MEYKFNHNIKYKNPPRHIFKLQYSDTLTKEYEDKYLNIFILLSHRVTHIVYKSTNREILLNLVKIQYS